MERLIPQPLSLELLSLLGVLRDVLETALGHNGLPRRQYDGQKVVKTWDLMAVEAASPSTPIVSTQTKGIS